MASPKITLDMADGERKVYLPVCATATVKPLRWEVWVDGKKKYQVPNSTVPDTTPEFGVDLAITSGKHRITVQAIWPDGKGLKESRNITIK